MSKRKREIEKRKQQTESAHKDESFQSLNTAEDGMAVREAAVDDSQIVSARAPAAGKKKSSRKRKPSDPESTAAAIPDSWFGQNKERLLLGLLILYVFLLGLGTMGELFEVEWILNLPLFK